MNNEEPTQGVLSKKIVPIVGLILLVLLAVAQFGFGLPSEIVNVALSFIMIGFFGFGVVASLRSGRRVVAAIAFICLVAYVVMIFCVASN